MLGFVLTLLMGCVLIYILLMGQSSYHKTGFIGKVSHGEKRRSEGREVFD